jgi:hypothetical protein
LSCTKHESAIPCPFAKLNVVSKATDTGCKAGKLEASLQAILAMYLLREELLKGPSMT